MNIIMFCLDYLLLFQGKLTYPLAARMATDGSYCVPFTQITTDQRENSYMKVVPCTSLV